MKKAKYVIERLAFPIDGVYKYNVQRWAAGPKREGYYYAGVGRYFRTEAEAIAYMDHMTATDEDARTDI